VGDRVNRDTPAPRIVCVGANLESEIALRTLFAERVPVAGLVTLPTGAPGAGSDYVDLHPLCEDASVPVLDAVDINDASAIDRLREWRPDVIFTLGWSQLFGRELLETPTHFVVGSHPSPLPRGRGRAPIPWTILEGAESSAITLFKMDPGVDAGPILKQRWFDVAADVYAGELYRLVATHLGQAFVELYRDMLAGTVVETPQEASQATYRAKRTAADGHLDFSRPAADLARLIRAVSHPYPGAYTYLGDRRVVFERAELADSAAYRGLGGQILRRSRGRILVQAGDAALWLWQARSDDGPMAATAFPLGARFGYRLEDEVHALRAEVRRLRQALEERE
jgi:methionyl-tRNA formyltransferase